MKGNNRIDLILAWLHLQNEHKRDYIIVTGKHCETCRNFLVSKPCEIRITPQSVFTLFLVSSWFSQGLLSRKSHKI